MASLYEDGWRQGTLFEALMPLDAVILGEAAQPERRLGMHSRWVVATQDCDLYQVEAGDAEPAIEIRPVFTEDPPHDWGIRSALLLLTERDYLRSASPRAVVSAAVLTALKDAGTTIRQIDPMRRRAFTIWLGKRYDRPAVPTELIPLAKQIGEAVKARRNRPTGARIRDVLMQFDESANPPRYSLFAVLDNAADEDEVRLWLSEIALKVPAHLGVADELEAATARGISLELIETSYSADVSQLTWRSNNPDPEGAM
jgi:hypothetical protein